MNQTTATNRINIVVVSLILRVYNILLLRRTNRVYFIVSSLFKISTLSLSFRHEIIALLLLLFRVRVRVVMIMMSMLCAKGEK